MPYDNDQNKHEVYQSESETVEETTSFEDALDHRGDIGGFFIPPNTGYPKFE